MRTTQEIDYATHERRALPRWFILCTVLQILTPVVTMVIAASVSVRLHKKWGLAYPTVTQATEHMRWAEDAPLVGGLAVMLLATLFGRACAWRDADYRSYL